LLTFAIAFICGIAAFRFFPFFPFTIIALFAVMTLLLFIRQREYRKRAVLMTAVVLLGFFYGLVRQETLPEIDFPDTEVSVEGDIADVPEMSEGRLSFMVDHVDIDGKGINGKIRLVAHKEYFSEDVSAILSPGDRISASAVLRASSAFRNPGVFSYDLKKEGVAASGYVKGVKVLSRGSGLASWIYQKRQALGRIMDSGLSAENASFHKALVPGLKKGISIGMRNAFSTTGLAHLLSISGTHFGLLAFIIYNLVRLTLTYMPVRLLTGLN